MKNFFRKLIYAIIHKLKNFYEFERSILICKKFAFLNVSLGYGHIDGNISIGEYTYINNGFRIVTGSASKIHIGSYCAIGRNFMCASRSHSKHLPTCDINHEIHQQIEDDIFIGNEVWIGDNVIIKQGVKIDNNSIIGANSVVTKNVRPFEIVGGVPAKHIAYNTDHYKYKI